MPTFAEVQSQLKQVEHRRDILDAVVKYLDSNFLTHGSNEARKKILGTDERSVVPEDAIEDVVSELTEEIASANAELERIRGLQVPA